MSENVEGPRSSSRKARPQILQGGYYSIPGLNSPDGPQQLGVSYTPGPDEQMQQGEYYSTPGMPPSNGASQFAVPARPFPHLPAPPSFSVTSPSVTSPPFPGLQPAIVDPRVRDRVERYAQWLLVNNNLPASQQKLQAYQEAALEIKKIGKREVRTFAPFQEHTSALQVITPDQLTILAILAIYWIIGLFFLHLAMFTITIAVVSLLYICGFITSAILATSSFNGSSGEKIDEEIIVALDQLGVEWPTYTILCPLYKESAIVPQFVEAMKSLDYPMDKLQVLFLTEENDNETRAALYSLRLPPDFTVLTVPKGSPQTKPRACNFGLLQAKGQFIVIFDAEDKPEPYQLKKAVLTFANHGPEVACVQAKLNYYNSKQNLLTRWFTAEYSTWFDILLPGLQRTGFALPLGGTSNHFRTEVLRAIGGWDAFNVTEDCDLGLRIAQYNLKTAVLDSTTYEEATSRVKTWLFQRSRWIKGYLQTYLVHMRHPLQTLQKGHFRKFFSLQLIVGAWTVVLLINPVMWALTLLYVLFRPVQLYSILFPGPILYMGAFCLIFGNFFYVYIQILGCLRRQEYALMKWVLLLPLYWLMMSASAYIAFYQLIVKPHYWEKTQHGTHLAPSARAQVLGFAPGVEQDGHAVVVSMPTTHLFAITVGRVFKHTITSNELGTTTQRVTALRSTLSTRLGQRKVRRQIRLPLIRDRWLLATIGIAIVVSVAATWYSFQHNDILLYDDAYSHMHIARSVIDSLTPGFGQLGSSWLPLPHLLMLPLIWNDYLYQTGLAGSILSMICYIIASLYLFLTARRLTKNSGASFVGALVFILNPNVIYLQTTPLSEPVCFATFAMAGFYFVAWAQDDRIEHLTFAAASVFLTTIARYDGWFLFLSMFVLVAAIGLVRRHSWRRIEGNLLIFGALGSFGIILWLAWNIIIFGDPLYFEHGAYSSHEQMQYTLPTQLAIVNHNLWQAVRYYSLACLSNLGPIVSILAVIAVVKFVVRRQNMPEMLAALSFLTPLIFYIFSFYSGQVIVLVPGVSSLIFNARFGSEAAIPAALFIATLANVVARLPKPQLNAILHFIFVIILIVQSAMIINNGIITLEEGQYGLPCTARQAVNFYLAQHYNGGLVLEDTYLLSPNESQEVGIPLRNIIYQGSGAYWRRALKDPGAVVDWIIIGARGQGNPYPVQVNTTSTLFKSQFTLVIKSQSFDLYLRNGLPSLPARPVPASILTEHQYCNTGKYPPKGL